MSKVVVVAAEWTVAAGPATDSDQSLLADALAHGDPCVWLEEARPNVVLASFDVTAATLDEGLASGREFFPAAARTAAVAGSLTRITAMDEEGYVNWST